MERKDFRRAVSMLRQDAWDKMRRGNVEDARHWRKIYESLVDVGNTLVYDLKVPRQCEDGGSSRISFERLGRSLDAHISIAPNGARVLH